MDFIKKNIVIVVSIAVAVLSIVMMIIGIGRISYAKEELNSSTQYINEINSILKGVPVKIDGRTINLIPTEDVVKQLEEIANSYKAASLKVLEDILHHNIGYDPKRGTTRRDLIIDGVFPKVTSQDRPFLFRGNYRSAMKGLLDLVSAGNAPTEEEIAKYTELVRQDLGFLISKTADQRGGQEVEYTEDKIKQIAIQKAVLAKASSIKLYCSEDTLDIIKEAYLTTLGQPPTLEDMWWAQLSYWLQKDIFTAIAQTNEGAKDVTESIVKRILSLKIMHGYIVEGGFIARDEANLPDSFTGLTSNKYFDVTRFSITAIVNQAKLPIFINNMYKLGHYTLYLCNIEAITLFQEGPTETRRARFSEEDLYYYGSEPVVKVTMYWETYLLRDFYHWGIIGYDLDQETGKVILKLYDGTQIKVNNLEDRKPIEEAGKGLMPESIRKALAEQ